MREDTLSKELLLINNEELREWTKQTLAKAPDYFFNAQASSTGQYHPACTIKQGGLIVHVKRAVYIANRLRLGWGVKGIDIDIVLSATILHDIAKTGRGSGSYDDYLNHPLNAKKYYEQPNEAVKDMLPKVNSCIENHMGLWTPESIKKPLTDYTLLELLVYTADYMATTKDLVTPKDEV